MAIEWDLIAELTWAPLKLKVMPVGDPISMASTTK